MPDYHKYESYRDTEIPWLGQIPSPWQLVLLSQVVTQVKNKNTALQENNLLSLSYGKIKRKPIDSSGGLLPESFDGYNIIEENDIVLRLTDLQNDHTSLRVGISPEKGIITSAYTTMRPRNNTCAKYLFYLLHTFDIRKGFYGMGSGVRQGLNYDEVKRLQIPWPTVEEQIHISEYLDRETDKINTIISEAKASIEEYKAWKASIIYEAVTKGLDPNIEMKDSSIEWIGEIPIDWTCCKQKYVIKLINGRAYKDSEFEENGKYKILRVGNLFSNPTWYSSSLELDEDKYCENGDLLYAWSMSYGPVIWTGEKVIYHYHIWKTKLSQKMDLRFTYYYLLALSNHIRAEAHATTMGFVTMETMNNSFIAFPELDKQIEIAAYLDKKCEQIDTIIADKESLIYDLESYKKSLIFEVVTGKRRVC